MTFSKGQGLCHEFLKIPKLAQCWSIQTLLQKTTKTLAKEAGKHKNAELLMFRKRKQGGYVSWSQKEVEIALHEATDVRRRIGMGEQRHAGTEARRVHVKMHWKTERLRHVDTKGWNHKRREVLKNRGIDERRHVSSESCCSRGRKEWS